MKRLRRRAFNFAAAVSAVLFAAVCVLWVRGYRWRDQVSCDLVRGWNLRVVSYVGGLYIVADDEWHGEDASCSKIEWQEPRGQRDDRWWSPPNWMEVFGYGLDHYWAAGGFVFTSSRRFGYYGLSAGPPPPDYGYYHVNGVAVPDWFLLLCLSLPLLFRWRARCRKSLRAGNRLCFACGYDLRATPSRCPECGAVPDQARPAAK